MVAVPFQRANQINKASVECSGGMSKDADHVGISGKNS